MSKKAATEWSVAKLTSFILLIIFLVLVIYGISTGGFKPLFAKISNQADGVLVSLHLKEPPKSNVSSVRVDIPGVGPADMTMTPNECKVDILGSKKGYRLGADFKSLEQYFPVGWRLVDVDAADVNFKKKIYDAFKSFRNQSVGFDGTKDWDSYIGLTLKTTRGIYGFGSHYFGEVPNPYSSNSLDSGSFYYPFYEHYESTNEKYGSVYLWYFNGSTWQHLTKEDLEAMPASADKDWKWNLYKAFKSFYDAKVDGHQVAFVYTDVYTGLETMGLLSSTRDVAKNGILAIKVGENNYYGYDPHTTNFYWSTGWWDTWTPVYMQYMTDNAVLQQTQINIKIKEFLLAKCR